MYKLNGIKMNVLCVWMKNGMCLKIILFFFFLISIPIYNFHALLASDSSNLNVFVYK